MQHYDRATDQQLAIGFIFEILVHWFSILAVGTGFIPRLLKELYGRIVNLEFQRLGMSATEMYMHNI